MKKRKVNPKQNNNCIGRDRVQGRGEGKNERMLDRRDQCSLYTCMNESRNIDSSYVNKMNVK